MCVCVFSLCVVLWCAVPAIRTYGVHISAIVVTFFQSLLNKVEHCLCNISACNVRNKMYGMYVRTIEHVLLYIRAICSN